MSTHDSLTTLAELLYRALKAQSHYAQDHPQAVQSVEAALGLLRELLARQSPLVLAAREGRLWAGDRPLEGAPNASTGLARELEARGLAAVVFHTGLDTDELQLLLFALQLRPERFLEMGGATALLPEGSNLRLMDVPPEDEEAPEPAPEALPPTMPLPPPLDVPEPAAPVPPPSAPSRPAPPPPQRDLDPTPELPPNPTTLAADLRSLMGAILQMTAAPPAPGMQSPWGAEQRESLAECGFLVPDFASMAGTGSQLGLGRLDPVTLRDTVRVAISGLDPMAQGAILLGLPTFPSEEQALRRALDYLGPEFFAQAMADVQIRHQPGRFTLALVGAALLQCVKDRELSMEALRGRLQFEGWSLEDLDALKEAILWECHGTDTKLRMSLMDRGVFELEAHQVMVLLRQLVRGRRVEGVKDLLQQLEAGFASPQVHRRRHAAEILADLAECLEELHLSPDLEQRFQTALHDHILAEGDQPAMLWSCQALETLLGVWLRRAQFDGVYREMLSLGELAIAGSAAPDWKIQAVRDLLGRMASPVNMAVLLPMLYEGENVLALGQLHSLLALLGRPAAHHLVHCLETETDKDRRSRLLGALRAIGRNGVPVLKEALASPHWFMVRNAVVLLGEIGVPSTFQEVALALEHRDPRVRRAAVIAVRNLGSPQDAAETLAKALPREEAPLQLEILAALGELRQASCVPAVVELVHGTRGTGEDALRVRLRAVEVLGLVASPLPVPALQELFRKKGLLGGRESTAIRLEAARALARINTREAREAIALALDAEPHEDVKAVLRQYLVGGPA